jgi:sugar/nucleoside kinase (ribokinase family)
VVVGSVTRDVDRTDPRGWRLGGTAPYVALGLARLGLRVGLLLGADREAAGAHELALFRASAVDLEVVPLAECPVFENRETPAGRRQVCLSVGPPLDPAAVPARWARTWALALAPVAGELGEDWAAVLPRAALVALALQGTLRVLAPGRPTDHRPLHANALTRRADLMMVGRDDLAAPERPSAVGPGTGPGSGDAAGSAPLESLETLLARPGQRIVVSSGAAGGILLRRGANRCLQVRRYPALQTEAIVDLTGAGDSFLAGWLAAELTMANPSDARALHLAAATASLKVAGYGLDGLPTLAALRRRLTAGRPISG